MTAPTNQRPTTPTQPTTAAGRRSKITPFGYFWLIFLTVIGLLLIVVGHQVKYGAAIILVSAAAVFVPMAIRGSTTHRR